MSFAAFKRALAHFGDNRSAMARAVGTSQQRICYILDHENPLPSDLVIATEESTGIPRHELRPDLYPRNPRARRRAA